MSKLSVDELLAQATCAVLIDGQIAGTAWLASQEGHLLTAGHLLCKDINACNEAYDEVEVQFTDDKPRIARKMQHHIQFDAGIDFAVLQVVDMPLDRKPLPISLTQSVELNSKLKLRGYGRTFSGPTIGEGKFKAAVDREDSSSNRLFRYHTQELAEEGFSGGAVYSEQLGAVVAIQIEAVIKRFGNMSGMVLAMPLYRIAELSSDTPINLTPNGKNRTTQLRQPPPKSPLLKRGIEAVTPLFSRVRGVLLFPFGLLTDKKRNNKASKNESISNIQKMIVALFVLVFVVAQVRALVPSFEWSLPELATAPAEEELAEEPAITPAEEEPAEEEWVEIPEATPSPSWIPPEMTPLLPTATEWLWSSKGGILFNTLEGHIGKVNSVAFSPDSRTMAFGSLDDTLRLWSSHDTLSNSLDQVTLEVMSVAFSPDGKTLASAFGNEVRLWSSKDGTLINTLRGHKFFVTSVAFSPDGSTIASGSLDNSVRLWSSDGTLIKSLDEHTSGVTSVAFSPDGDTIASGSLDDSVRLWSSNGTLINTLDEHTSDVTSVAFSPDGKKLASGSTDNTVRLWKPDGTSLKTLEAHTSSVESVIFSPDSKTLASGLLDGTVCLWRVSDGKLLVTLKKHTDSVESVAFSPDGRILASGSQDSTIRLWGVQGRSQNLGGSPQ